MLIFRVCKFGKFDTSPPPDRQEAPKKKTRSFPSQEYTIEQPQSDVCGACAVRANDPFVKVTFGRREIFSRWWFQMFVIFTPTWGNDPVLTHIFQRGWKYQAAKTRVQRYSFSLCLCLGQCLLKPIAKDLLELLPLQVTVGNEDLYSSPTKDLIVLVFTGNPGFWGEPNLYSNY